MYITVMGPGWICYCFRLTMNLKGRQRVRLGDMRMARVHIGCGRHTYYCPDVWRNSRVYQYIRAQDAPLQEGQKQTAGSMLSTELSRLPSQFGSAREYLDLGHGVDTGVALSSNWPVDPPPTKHFLSLISFLQFYPSTRPTRSPAV